MSTPREESSDHVDLAKSSSDQSGTDAESHAGSDSEQPLDFDPYRFGLPDHPVPAEYAPPGYVPPTPPPPAAGADPYSPYGPGSPYGSPPPTPPPGNQYGQGHGGPDQYGQGQYGQGQYGQHPYGPPPAYGPPPGYNYPVPGQVGVTSTHNRGKAIAALVCGILSIVLCWLTLFDALLVIPALVLALMVITDKRSSGRGMAVAGLVCAIVGAIAAIALFVWLAPIARDCSDRSGSARNQCIEDRI